MTAEIMIRLEISILKSPVVIPKSKDQNFVSKGRFGWLGNGNVSETRWKQRKNGKYKETFGNIT